MTVKPARVPEFDVKSPPTSSAKQVGSAVVVTVAVIVDTEVIVLVLPMEGHDNCEAVIVVVMGLTVQLG
jgi:hypothetical protein